MKKGFTIIEVALVIALAGLIFLAVFVALPTLQASSRDTVRKDDMTKVVSAIAKYSANHRGTLASNFKDDENKINDFIAEYLGSNFTDPSGEPYKFAIVDFSADGEPPFLIEFDHTIHIYYHSKCANETITYTTDKRDYSILYRLEGSGTYCINVDN